jgi:hypothetical protein
MRLIGSLHDRTPRLRRLLEGVAIIRSAISCQGFPATVDRDATPSCGPRRYLHPLIITSAVAADLQHRDTDDLLPRASDKVNILPDWSRMTNITRITIISHGIKRKR